MDNSPLVVFVDLEYKGIVVLFGLFNLEELESLENKSHEEDRGHNGNDEEDIGEEEGDLSDWSGVVLVLDLHHGEEGEVEVDQHEETDVGVELELAQTRTCEVPESIRIRKS